MAAAEFPFSIPADVPEEYELPHDVAPTPENLELSALFGTTGQYVNIVYELMREEDTRDVFKTARSGLVDENLIIVRQQMEQIEEVLQQAGNGAFPIPADLVNAFVFLKLAPEADDDEAEDAQA